MITGGGVELCGPFPWRAHPAAPAARRSGPACDIHYVICYDIGNIIFGYV